MFHIEPQLTTRNRCIQTLVSHQLLSLFHREQKQISYQQLSINFHTNSSLWTLTKTLVYQRFYICFMMSKVIGNNSHTSSCLSTLLSILVSSRASWVETTLTQTLVYQLSYKRLSLSSHTNSCLSTLIQTLVYQLSYKLLCINSHTHSCLSIIMQTLLSISTLTQTLVCQLSSVFHHEQGESKQLSYKLLSIHSHTSKNSLILVATTRV